jgi:hypothetical protein
VSHSDMHVSDDLLATAAMGDPIPDVERQHVADCPACAAQLAEYSQLLDLGRRITPDDVPDAPSPVVWQGITAELGLGGAKAQVAEPAEVVALAPRRTARWTTSWLVAAAAVGVIAGVGVTAAGGAMVGDDPPPVAAPPPVVAQAALAPLPSKQGTGSAEIVQTANGPELVVDVSDLSAGDGFYEVWLIDPKTFEMVGLGALTQNEGRFPIPDGLDLSQYRVVDVSIEPYDGDPVHSRDSVVRGELNV